MHQRAKQAMHNTAPADQLRAKQIAAKQIMSLLGLGLAGGVGVRGMMGLRDMVTTPSMAVSPSSNLPHTISLFGPPKDDEKSKVVPMQKAAVGPAQPIAIDRFTKAIAPYLPNTHTQNPLMNEWAMPAGVAALAGGGVAGYSLADWLLQQNKKRQGANAVQSAEDEYRQALADQYRAAMMAKNAGDDFGLTSLADEYVAKVEEAGMTKEAFFQSLIDKYVPGSEKGYSSLVGYDNWQGLKGGVNTAAMLAMLGTGKVTYDWAKGQNKQELLAKALKRRQLMRQQLSPPPIIALPEEDNSATNAA